MHSVRDESFTFKYSNYFTYLSLFVPCVIPSYSKVHVCLHNFSNNNVTSLKNTIKHLTSWSQVTRSAILYWLLVTWPWRVQFPDISPNGRATLLRHNQCDVIILDSINTVADLNQAGWFSSRYTPRACALSVWTVWLQSVTTKSPGYGHLETSKEPICRGTCILISTTNTILVAYPTHFLAWLFITWIEQNHIFTPPWLDWLLITLWPGWLPLYIGSVLYSSTYIVKPHTYYTLYKVAVKLSLSTKKVLYTCWLNWQPDHCIFTCYADFRFWVKLKSKPSCCLISLHYKLNLHQANPQTCSTLATHRSFSQTTWHVYNSFHSWLRVLHLVTEGGIWTLEMNKNTLAVYHFI